MSNKTKRPVFTPSASFLEGFCSALIILRSTEMPELWMEFLQFRVSRISRKTPESEKARWFFALYVAMDKYGFHEWNNVLQHHSEFEAIVELSECEGAISKYADPELAELLHEMMYDLYKMYGNLAL